MFLADIKNVNNKEIEMQAVLMVYYMFRHYLIREFGLEYFAR
jgi:hypothetical protein